MLSGAKNMLKCICVESRLSISLYAMCATFDELLIVTLLQALLLRNMSSNTYCMGLILAQVL